MKLAQYYSSDMSNCIEGNNIFDKSNKCNYTNENSLREYKEVDNESMKEQKNIMTIYKRIFLLAMQATIVFGVTFLVYPGTILSTKFDMLDGNKSAESWFNIIMLTIFSLCDTIGRFLAGVWRPFNKNTIAIMTFGRFVFIFTSIAIQLGKNSS